jgi:hypothetical protein
MHRNVCSAVLATVLFGCASGTTSAPAARTAAAIDDTVPHAASLAETRDPFADVALAWEEVAASIGDHSTLPVAPWAAAPLGSSEVPAPLLAAWERAENREWCAPIAPRDLGAADGAVARSTELASGWAVEFDRRGLPGVGRDGGRCERCGRGVFGIAGTAMTPDALIDAESDARLPPASFSDGSHAEIEIGESESVAAATITVSGQGCVYQVWSFLGQEHLEGLVRELRRVDVPQGQTTGAIALRDER